MRVTPDTITDEQIRMIRRMTVDDDVYAACNRALLGTIEVTRNTARIRCSDFWNAWHGEMSHDIQERMLSQIRGNK